MSEHDSHTVHRETDIVHGSIPYDAATGAVSVPIYQSATFRHPALHETTGFDYSRGLNPTRSALESAVALLERGRYGLAFSSGMGAISALIKLFSPGDHLIVSADLYGGTWRLFNDYYAKYGLRFGGKSRANRAGIAGLLPPKPAACSSKLRRIR